MGAPVHTDVISHPLTVAKLAVDRPTEITLEPDAAARALIADALGLSGLRKLRLSGAIRPTGKRDWTLEAILGATVVQPCVVTLAPVTTRIDEPVTRRYLAVPAPDPTGDEAEMPEDDTQEPLPEVIDLGALMLEALAIALPAFPRAEGAELADGSFGPPGAAPIETGKENPFAALEALKSKMGDAPDEAGSG